MVRQWQEMFYDERYSEVYLSPDLPDYVQLGRGDGLHRHPRRVARGGAAGDRQGQRDRRPPGRRRVPRRRRREGVPDGAGRHVATTTSSCPSSQRQGSCCDEPSAAATTSCPCSSRTRPACSPAWPALFARRGYNIFSLAVAPTEDERFSRITIVVDVESAPLEQIVKQLFKLISVVKISELDPRRSRRARAAARHRARRRRAARPGRRARAASSRARSWPSAPRRITVSLDGHPDKLDDFEELLRRLWHRGAAAHRPGRAAQARPRGVAPPRR